MHQARESSIDDEAADERCHNLYCSALRELPSSSFRVLRIANDVSKSRYLLIVENCIEKNFHVSNMKAVRAHISVCVRMQFQRKRQYGFVRPKTGEAAYVKVQKSAQVDTLASQAMKDVASCDKLGGAANER